MDVSADVPITFLNKTSGVHRVVVFSRNASDYGGKSANPYVVWRTLRTQGTATFTYPAEFGIGITWTSPKDPGLRNQAGPYTARPGSRWLVTQGATSSGTPYLSEVEHAPGMESIAASITNVDPKAWNGIPITCSLYKAGLVIATHLDLKPGQTTQFALDATLHFGLAPDVFDCQENETFPVEEISFMNAHMSVCLKEYPNGLTVELCQDEKTKALGFYISQTERGDTEKEAAVREQLEKLKRQIRQAETELESLLSGRRM